MDRRWKGKKGGVPLLRGLGSILGLLHSIALLCLILFEGFHEFIEDLLGLTRGVRGAQKVLREAQVGS